MPDPHKEVRASRALVRVRRLAALPEPKRTSALIAHAKRIPRRTLIDVVNGLNIDRFIPLKPREPATPGERATPKASTPAWALDLPLEFLAVMCRRLWPTQFRVAGNKPPPAKTGTIGDRIKLLQTRRLAGMSMWNDDGDETIIRGKSRRERLGARREYRDLDREPNGKPTRSSKVDATPRRALKATIDEEDERMSDEQLVHEWMCMYVYGQGESKSLREIIAASLLARRGK